jgi:hypothetical protein
VEAALAILITFFIKAMINDLETLRKIPSARDVNYKVKQTHL